MRHFLSELCILISLHGHRCRMRFRHGGTIPPFRQHAADSMARKSIRRPSAIWMSCAGYGAMPNTTTLLSTAPRGSSMSTPSFCVSYRLSAMQTKRNGTGCSPNGYTVLESSRRPPNVMNRTAAKDSGTKLPQRGRPIRQSWAANCPTCYAASGSPTGAGSIAMSNRDSPEAPVRTSPGRTVIRT